MGLLNCLDVRQQRIVAQMTALSAVGLEHKVLAASRQTNAQHSALHRGRPHVSAALNKGVFHRWAFTKYAIALSICRAPFFQ